MGGGGGVQLNILLGIYQIIKVDFTVFYKGPGTSTFQGVGAVK